MLVRLFYSAWELCTRSPNLRRVLVRFWYDFVSLLDKDAEARFMNYGYAELSPVLSQIELMETDEPHRYSIQLYQHLTRAIDLTGLDVLEVGSGRGGGADYVMRYLRPRSLIGLDLSAQAVKFCGRYYTVPGLTFVYGTAEHLPFEDHTVDVVINVESSSHYGNLDRFLQEVYRVLRPNGCFLFADIRAPNEIPALCSAFDRAGFGCPPPRYITANVVRALDLDSQRRRRLIEQKTPPPLQDTFKEFAGIKGTDKYEWFRTGMLEYLSFVMHQKIDTGSEIVLTKAHQ